MSTAPDGPHEDPALSVVEPRKGARRALIVFGALGVGGRDGHRPEEVAVVTRRNVYLGPIVGSNGEPFDRALAELMVWRVKSVMLNMAGVVVPQLDELTDLEQDLILEVTRSWAVGSDSGVRLVDAPTAPVARLPLWRVRRRGRDPLLEVTAPRSGTSQATLRAMLDERAPSVSALNDGVMSVVSPSAESRDFAHARTVAADLHRAGISGVGIAHYLTAYGYVNSRGVPGAWHHARLREALAGDR